MRWTIILFLFPMFCCLTGTVSAQQTFHVLRAGSNCGRLTLSYEKLSNGYRQCELREEWRYQDIDDKSTTWRRVLTVLVDSAMQPLSVHGREFSRDNEYRIDGSCVQGTMYLSRQDKHGEVHSHREDCNSVPDIFLPILLTETEIPFPRQVFSTRDLATRSAKVTSSELADGTQQINCDYGGTFVVAPDGGILSWSLPAIGLSYIESSSPVSGIEPCDIDCGVFWDAGQAALPTPVENVRGMTVRLSLTREVGARLIPEDIRQGFASEQPSSGAQVNLQLKRTWQRHGDETLPVRDDELLGYLGESPLLTVTAEGVRDRAAMLRAMDRGIGSIAGQIQQWMGGQFVRDIFVPSVQAQGLVRTPRGNSFHAAILATAIARAAGIPARLVLGVQPEQGRWRSTVWIEIWSGTWVSIDPVTGEFINDPVHIKLLHAENEIELREQAQRLRGALRIDALDVEEMDNSAAGALRTGVINGVYTDRDFRFSLRAPQGWMIERREKGVETELVISPEAGSDVRCEVLLSRYPYPIVTRDAFDAKVRALGVVLVDVEIADKGEIRIGELKAPYVLYSYRDTAPAAGARRITTADCIFTIFDRGYLIRFTAPSEDFRKYDAALQGILQNVVLYDK
jgi:hypothetical protein